jgi:regulator of sigma E protease
MLIIVVGVHELGHALVARIFSIDIKRICIGFSKPLLTYTSRSGLQWTWALVPLGGYVELLDSRIEPVSPEKHPYCLDKKPVWQRLLVYLAGPTANFIVALILFNLVFFIGIKQYPPVIKAVIPNSIAATAGLRANDVIKSINKQPVNTWSDVGMRLIENLGSQKKLSMQVKSSNLPIKKVGLDISHWKFGNAQKNLLASLGIKQYPREQISPQLLKLPFVAAMKKAANDCLDYLIFYLNMIKQLIVGNIPFMALLGPIGMFEITIISFSQGMLAFSSFIAAFSLAVGLVNLFPFPGIDGGAITYLVIEKLRGKPLSFAVETLLQRLALIVFIVLFVHLLMNDLQRYLA